jgi:hypothetical protein
LRENPKWHESCERCNPEEPVVSNQRLLHKTNINHMNSIVYIVGAVVIVIVILKVLGIF